MAYQEETPSKDACLNCGNQDKANMRCSRCKDAVYCSRVCQKADWKNHKKTCCMSFSLAELYDPSNAAAKVARNTNIPYCKYYEYYNKQKSSVMVMDRVSVRGPFAQRMFEGIGDYYVGTDIATLKFVDTDTSLAPGQYYSNDFVHSPPNKKKWKRYDDGNEAPGNTRGGFFKAVLDTKQPGTKWTLSAKPITTTIMGGLKVTGPKFVALAREDYCGFKYYERGSSQQSEKDQCRGHLMITEFTSLSTGKILIEDAANDDGGGDDENFDDDPSNNGGMVELAMDGYYPIQIHYDSNGLMDCILVKCLPTTEDYERALARV